MIWRNAKDGAYTIQANCSKCEKFAKSNTL